MATVIASATLKRGCVEVRLDPTTLGVSYGSRAFASSTFMAPLGLKIHEQANWLGIVIHLLAE